MRRDLCDDLAALALPLPTSADQVSPPPDALDDAIEDIQRRREDYAEQLRVAYDGGDVDPVLAEIRKTRRARSAADQRLRQLIAYAREFTGPRPYALAGLAEAAGLANHSSARTFYGPDEVTVVAAIIGAKRRATTPSNSPSGPTEARTAASAQE